MKRIPNNQLTLTEYLVCLHEGKPFTGIGYTLDQHGNVLSESCYVAGRKEGIGRDWRVDNPKKLESVTAYKNNMRHGRRRVWHWSGHLKVDAVFEYDLLVARKTWDYSGNLESVWKIKEGDSFYKMLMTMRKGTPDE